jgi:hypothetical protein
VKVTKLLHLDVLVLILLVLFIPQPGQAQFMFTLADLQRAKVNVAGYNKVIRMSEALVNEIMDEMEGIRGLGLSKPVS